ncbi:MAG: hypothetical protein ACKN9S_05350 [Pirellula sp.]
MSKRSRGNDYAPSTFPFLAVLLCVIGALILLLVISVTNSRASAKNEVQEELSQAIEQAKENSDYLVSISEELQARRQQVKKQIESRRSELARTEDHITRLEKELEDAIARLRALEDTSSKSENSLDNSSRIEQLKDRIEEEKRKLSEKIEQQKDHTPAFSIIPYDGANRTTRRPVYLECTQEGVVIQPEGILITMEDLGPPHGPGNPLDAALRVLRTAYQARDNVYGITIPPYPLLLVRPDGIHSYALARSAMSGWDDQFGYELIDAQMELAFPEGIPDLKNELTKTLALAKDRQRALVAALPARFSRNPYANTSDDTWDSIDGPTSGGRTTGGSPTGNSGNSGKTKEDARRWEMIQQLPPGVVANSKPSDPSDLNPTAGDSQALGSSQGELLGDDSRVAQSGSGGQGRSDDSQATGASSSELSGTQSQGSTMVSSSSGRNASSRFSSSSSGSSEGASTAGQTAQEAELEQAIKEEGLKSKGQAKSQKGSGQSKSPGSDSELKPISVSAGKDWATTRMDNKSTPVSRPIRIIALQDRWLMCREGQEFKYDSEILLEQGPQAASEQLQQAIRERVESWGLSLPGGHWVPSLTVQTAADADQSVARLQRLLEGSGVVIRTEPLVPPTPGNTKR